MKKINTFGIFNIIGLVVGYFAIFRLLRMNVSDSFLLFDLPKGFPTANGYCIIWGFLFILWGVGCLFVYSVSLSQRRIRNIFLNSLILILTIFIWNYMTFSAANLSGALAISIAGLLLTIVVWFMYLVTHRYGGYLFTPTVIWQIFQLYLSIALTVKN